MRACVVTADAAINALLMSKILSFFIVVSYRFMVLIVSKQLFLVKRS